MDELLGCVFSFSVEENLEIMELEESASMGHCKEGNIQFLCFCVELGLKVHTHCTCTLVKNSEYWFMIEESGHRDSLFLSS